MAKARFSIAITAGTLHARADAGDLDTAQRRAVEYGKANGSDGATLQIETYLKGKEVETRTTVSSYVCHRGVWVKQSGEDIPGLPGQGSLFA